MLFTSDIFGISDAFLTLLKDVDVANNVIKISPYLQPQVQFKNELQAYQCFKDNGGMDAYILRVTDVILTHKGIKNVVGFSAGAAALYKVISSLPKRNIQLTLFYPGQIRNFLDKHPSSPCHIIFPESEPHFSLPDVIRVLKQQLPVKVEQSNYQHGFMNTDSKGFDQTAYNYYCQLLNKRLVNN